MNRIRILSDSHPIWIRFSSSSVRSGLGSCTERIDSALIVLCTRCSLRCFLRPAVVFSSSFRSLSKLREKLCTEVFQICIPFSPGSLYQRASELLSNLNSFVKIKQVFVMFCSSCLVSCLHLNFALAQFPQLLSSFGRCADEKESSENSLTRPCSAVAIWSSSTARVMPFVKFACLTVVVCFQFDLAHFVQISSALVV